jgi:hypothetical protein
MNYVDIMMDRKVDAGLVENPDLQSRFDSQRDSANSPTPAMTVVCQRVNFDNGPVQNKTV